MKGQGFQCYLPCPIFHTSTPSKVPKPTIMNPNISIREIMTTKLMTVSPDDTVYKVREIFNNNTFHHLPVVEPGQKLVGIISKEDLHKLDRLAAMEKVTTETEKEFLHLCAGDIMTEYPMQLDPEDSVGLAADIFLANKFHALPIVEDNTLVGMVTTHDLLKYSFESPMADDVKIF